MHPVGKKHFKRGLKDHAVIVFLKVPEPGRVKTRLSMSLDDSFVLDLYRGFIQDTLEILGKPGDAFVYFYPPENGFALKTWLGKEYACFPQTGQDLGDRMSNAFQEVFQKGYESAVLIGTDIPELSRDILVQAYHALHAEPVVIGPTGDGGYYLIGFQKSAFSETVFHDMDWSTPTVLDHTLYGITQLCLGYVLLPKLNDIDTPGDLDALAERVQKGGAAGRRTRMLLERYEN